MPTTYLWTVTNQGRVYTLSTCGQQWQELPYSGMEFKRVAAVEWCGWAIGGDHQMYVYVFSTDVPIRCKEVAYENQRWNPKESFCSRLLPTDRPAWSTEDGKSVRSRDRVKLPTLSWEWENDWQVEYNLDGQVVDPEGWMYAVDFPATYSRDKTWLSYVRRRKWIRSRRYVSTNSWANVPCIHDDPVTEPFIDAAVGGQSIPGGNSDSLAVWTVTVLGRIMFRLGVNTGCPEGTEWLHVQTPQTCEVNQLSVGPTGLVWAVTWNGGALVRMGVSRTLLHGCYWVDVEPPNEDSKLVQVSVGTNAVWAITRDNKVWFRRGVKGLDTENSEENAKGSGWVEMVGDMCLVSVGLNDQVWSLGADEHKTMYIRTGVVGQDFSGKTWKPILLSCLTSTQSFDSNDSEGSFNMRLITGHEDLVDVSRPSAFEENSVTSSSGVTEESCIPCVTLEEPIQSSDISVLVLDERQEEDKFSEGGDGHFEKTRESLQAKPKLSILRSRGSSNSSVQETSSLGHSGEDTGYFHDTFVEFSWSWISGSGCVVDGLNLPNWFSSGPFASQIILNEPWRMDIIKSLTERNKHQVDEFPMYEEAIEQSSWVITAKGKVFLRENLLWSNCKLELEKTMTEECSEMATLRCFPYDNFTDCEKVVFDMNSVTCTVCVSDYQKLTFAIYTPSRTVERKPLLIALSSDSELEDWLALLSNTCCELRGINGTPSPKAIWSLNNRGDIFVHDAQNGNVLEKTSEIFWRQLGGHLSLIETCPAGVVWGLGYDHTPWIYTGGWGGGFFKGMDSSGFGINPMHDTRSMYIYENQRWNPLSGFANKRLPTDRYAWSDKSGRRECTKENTKLPSIHWQWITDWTVDFSMPGGVDKDGWQYAKDFPMNFHGRKGFTDYVRRRRWFRKCKLSTCGPWEELDSVSLLDVSIQVDHSGCPLTPIHLWAVSIKGELLCRMGVTQSCPKGIYWEHVTTDEAVQSVSVGGGGEVWVITKSGKAVLRHGITEQTPIGSVWFTVEPPSCGCHKPVPLRHISAGNSAICAIDTASNLYFRQEVMRILPQGTHWKHVLGNYRCVSVGQNDEVWAIADIPDSNNGVVCRCINLEKQSIILASRLEWDYGIGGNWHYISVRGFP